MNEMNEKAQLFRNINIYMINFVMLNCSWWFWLYDDDDVCSRLLLLWWSKQNKTKLRYSQFASRSNNQTIKHTITHKPQQYKHKYKKETKNLYFDLTFKVNK